MAKKSSFTKNEATGFWEKDGKPHPYVTEIRTDKSLCSNVIRENLFKPHTLVAYDPKSIIVEKNDSGEDIHLIKVVPAENNGAEAVPALFCMLDLSTRQQRCLSNHYHVPTKVFVKNAVALHVEYLADSEEELLEIAG